MSSRNCIPLLALLCLFFVSNAAAQSVDSTANAMLDSTANAMLDSTANAMLDAADIPDVDVDETFDALESALSPHGLQFRARFGLDPAWQDHKAELDGSYLGSPFLAASKLVVSSDFIRLGIATQKDAFESNYADNWAAQLELANPKQLGAVTISKFVLGSYALHIGSGLIAGSGLSSMQLVASPSDPFVGGATVRRSLSPHSDVALQGGAATVELGTVAFTPFVSIKHADARIDSLGARTLYTFYHRTEDELSHESTLSEQTAGAHLQFRDSTSSLKLGLTALQTAYSVPLLTASSKLPTGRHLTLTGADAEWTSGAFTTRAEEASSKEDAANGIAYIASETFHAPRFATTLLVHHEAPTFHSTLGAIPGASIGDIVNDEGLFLGCEWKSSSLTMLSAGAELAHRLVETAYATTAPKLDAFVELMHDSILSQSLLARVRYRNEMDDAAIENDASLLDTRQQWNLRLESSTWITNWLSAKLRLEGTSVQHSRPTTTETGGQVQLVVAAQYDASRIRLFASRFSSASYDARLYSYSSTVSGYGNIVLLNGRGYYLSGSVAMKMLDALEIQAAFGGYFYDHARTIGSSLTTHRSANDLDAALQLLVHL